MRDFDYYEFAGVIAPGAVLVFGLARIYPEVGLLLSGQEVSLGEFGLILILAYVSGHLVQSLGNFIEWVWWGACGGWPSEWIRNKKHNILAFAQWDVLPKRIRDLLHIKCPDELGSISKDDWRPITRQIYVAVQKAGRANRVDIFNGNYGMFRGVAAALFVILVAALLDFGDCNWRLLGALFVMLLLALLRMHRFGVHYVRELFIQFIGINSTENAGFKKEEK